MPTKKFIVRETIIREFEVEANNATEAYEKAMNDGGLEYSDESLGVNEIIEFETTTQTIF
jgi:hypothetical protein